MNTQASISTYTLRDPERRLLEQIIRSAREAAWVNQDGDAYVQIMDLSQKVANSTAVTLLTLDR